MLIALDAVADVGPGELPSVPGPEPSSATPPTPLLQDATARARKTAADNGLIGVVIIFIIFFRMIADQQPLVTNS